MDNDDLIKDAKHKDILIIPGCLTPSEINIAFQNGLSLVKIFPADVVGKNYIKSVKPIFPNMDFMLTGGISSDASDIKDWLSSGAIAVGQGSALIENNIDLTTLKSKVETLLNQLNS